MANRQYTTVFSGPCYKKWFILLVFPTDKTHNIMLTAICRNDKWLNFCVRKRQARIRFRLGHDVILDWLGIRWTSRWGCKYLHLWQDTIFPEKKRLKRQMYLVLIWYFRKHILLCGTMLLSWYRHTLGWCKPFCIRKHVVAYIRLRLPTSIIN